MYKYLYYLLYYTVHIFVTVCHWILWNAHNKRTNTYSDMRSIYGLLRNSYCYAQYTKWATQARTVYDVHCTNVRRTLCTRSLYVVQCTCTRSLYGVHCTSYICTSYTVRRTLWRVHSVRRTLVHIVPGNISLKLSISLVKSLIAHVQDIQDIQHIQERIAYNRCV